MICCGLKENMSDKPRCNGNWTEARFISFIKSTLRGGSRRWAPKNEVKKEARVTRGKYKCKSCNKTVGASKVIDGKRVNNVFVDHINPIVDPNTGFTTWDDFIERLFCEKDNLQLLCKSCHDKKSYKEKEIAKKRKQNG